MSGGEMLELRFHFGERDRCGDRTLEEVVMDACARHGMQAAALLRGVEGFGAKHRVRTDRVLSLSEDAPLVAVAVGETARVEALVEELAERATTGTVTTTAAEVAVPVVGVPGDVGRDEGLVRATVWGPRSGPASPHLRAVDAFRRHGAEAATVLLGVDGVLGGERRRARFVAANRGVPALTVAVGRRDAIEAALTELDGVANLVIVQGVELSSRIERGKLPGAPALRVTLVTSEIATSGAHPRYLEFVRALRREGAAGATAVRGVWGFRGDGAPHGDRVLALRRDVPMVVEVIDAPEAAAHWLELARSIAEGDDVVHVGAVVKSRSLRVF